MTSISVIIPVYNSEKILSNLVDQLQKALVPLTRRFEVLLVNDSSSDNSWDVICELSARNEWLSGINLMRNYGQHNALLCGIRAAKNDIVVTMDDDLQHPPEEIAKLVRRLEEGYDVVYGKPKREQHGLWRDLASQITKLSLKSTMGVKTARNVSAFRAFRLILREGFAEYKSPYVSIDVLLTWGTNRFGVVAVNHNERESGTSNYTFRKLVTHAINMMTGFSSIPLQLASMAGFAFGIFGLCVLIYVVGMVIIYGSSVPGFPFLASMIAIFSGVQLFAIGIIGEYIARIHFRSMTRPYCVVRNKVGFISNDEKG